MKGEETMIELIINNMLFGFVLSVFLFFIAYAVHIFELFTRHK
jgi:hypothetical protein